MTTISSCDPLALSAAVDQMAENDRMRQAYEQSLQQPICDYTTAQWHYLADGKPEVQEGKPYVFVLISCRNKAGAISVWSGLYNPKAKNFRAVRGHLLLGVYAWAYLPNAAPWIEPEPTA